MIMLQGKYDMLTPIDDTTLLRETLVENKNVEYKEYDWGHMGFLHPTRSR